MGSDESHFNVWVGSDGQSHKTVSTNHNLLGRERRAEAVSNRGPSAYQPNALTTRPNRPTLRSCVNREEVDLGSHPLSHSSPRPLAIWFLWTWSTMKGQEAKISEPRSCVKGRWWTWAFILSPTHPSVPDNYSHAVPVDVKHHERRRNKDFRGQKPCKQGGGGPGLSFPIQFFPSP